MRTSTINKLKRILHFLAIVFLGEIFIRMLSGWKCPRCNFPLFKKENPCNNCGQEIDWRVKK